jgi:thiol-disulfide isomerase/thioredoxin
MFGGRILPSFNNNASFLSNLKSNISSNAVIIVLLVVVLIGISLYYYYTYVSPKFAISYTSNNSGSSPNQPTLMFFYTDWCPHCKTAKPEWEKLKQKYQGKTINGSPILFEDVNCTTETPDVEQTITKYKIEGYPTIKLLKDGQVIDFDSKPTQSSLEQFLNTVM